MRQILAALAIGGQLLGGPLAADEERTLTVTGEGQVAVAPDMAVVRIGVTTNAGTAAEALASNSAAMAAVLARLSEEGVADRDLQTSDLNLGPQFSDRSDGPPQVQGYTARNVLSVRVRDLDALGGVLDAVARDGANTFEGLNFGMSEPGPANDEALRLAVVDARRKAELLAGAAGVTLGEVRIIETGFGGSPRPMEMGAAPRMSADSVPVTHGELEVSAAVTVIFGIDD